MKHAALASLGIALVLVVILHEQVRHPASVPDLGDPLFSMWRTGWVNHQLVTDPRHLFDANIFHPERLTLTLSDPIVLPALTAAPLLAVGLPPAVAYNLLLFSGFWFSGIAVYLLVHRLTGSARAAFIAGLTYACYSYRFEHYSHLELQMTQWMPLALLALHLFVATGRWPYALALAMAGVAQLYSSMYYAVFFLVYAAAVGVGLLAVHRPRLGRLLPPLAVCGVLAALLAWPLARAFTAAEPMKGIRGEEEVRSYSARPSDYLRANKYSVLWSSVLRRPVPERTLFPGAAPLALAAVGVAPPLGALPLIYTAGLLVAFDGSLGLNGVSYPFYYRWLSPFRGLRSPARFAALVGLTLAILAGFGAQRALRWRASPGYQRAMFAALIAFVMIDAWPALTLTPVWKEPPSFYRTLQKMPRVVLAEFPVPYDETLNIPFMYFSLWHWQPMVNGYSGFIPMSYADLTKALVPFPAPSALAALRAHGVTYLTVNCGLGYEGCEETLRRMRQSPSLRLLDDATWEGHAVDLFELAGP
jgi:hypothetical protein